VGIKGFEQRLEGVVEGTFSRLFKTPVSPIEFGRKLVREMDQQRRLGVDGRAMVPNRFEFQISAADEQTLGGVDQTLRRELAEAAREHARDEGYAFVGPVEIEITVDSAARTGVLGLTARFVESPHGPGSLVLPTGDRVPLDEHSVTIGRDNTAVIVLGDPNASRRHAEVRPAGSGYAVLDLGALNGTKVNGVRITGMCQLADGDELQFGNTVIKFEAS
jgi:hypothetical protein